MREYCMVDLLTMEYAAAEITWRRKEIARRLIGTSANIKDHTINRIAPADLELLFGLYDELFLAGWFRHCFAGTLGFSLSSRLTKSAGKTLCPKDIAQRKPSEIRIEIRIGVNFFLQYHAVKNPKPVCGIATADSLEALQLVLEHEICHVIEFLHFHASNCSAARFKRLAGRLFGHTESYHKLPTAQQIARQKYGLRIGDAVSFRFEDTVLHGRVYRLNQRATVMVRDRFGHYTDGNGRRYTKYYVPLELLQK